jgi:bacillithiol synthase
MPSINTNNLPFFSNLVKDYLNENKQLKTLYSFSPTMDGLKQSILSKEKNYTKRNLLNKIIDINYPEKGNLTQAETNNLKLLRENGLAITTAHQPCLFLGPLYIISKAISTISLANTLNIELGEKKIVPVFVIGSEDHDKEEILHANLFGKKYEWQTEQTGAIGSMKLNENFNVLLNEWMAAFGNLSYAEELKIIYTESYKQGNTVSQSFGNLLKKLFGHHGLIVLDINIPEVKETMIPVFEKELKNNYSSKAIQSNLVFLRKEYTVQAEPRDINLFEYKYGERTRIDTADGSMIERLYSHPELFSPNVILRPLMQQTVLPSIANIGGGAEVAYWLELKPIFDIEKIDFPVIILRDIFSPIDKKSMDKWTENKLELGDFFLTIDELNKKIILQDSTLEQDFKTIEDKLISEFNQLEMIIYTIDKSLIGTYEMELIKLKKSIELLYGKSIKAEKRKSEELLLSIEKIKTKVFESNSLVERKENFSSYYLKYGSAWIYQLIMESNPLGNQWKLIVN